MKSGPNNPKQIKICRKASEAMVLLCLLWRFVGFPGMLKFAVLHRCSQNSSLTVHKPLVNVPSTQYAINKGVLRHETDESGVTEFHLVGFGSFSFLVAQFEADYDMAPCKIVGRVAIGVNSD